MTRQVHREFHLYPSDKPFVLKLKIEQQAALNAVEVKGMTYEAAGQWLAISIGTVKSRVHRARDHIERMRAEAAPAQQEVA